MTQMAHYSQTNANVKSIGFTYDAAGNLTGYNDGTTSAAYTYDALYRKTEETVHYGAFSLTTRYAYNANGTKKSFTYPNGMAVDYTYDANNQLTSVNIPYAGNISYNAYQWTRPTAVTLPSSSGTKQYAYDELMRTKTILSKDPSQNPVLNYQYTYDKMDNIKTRNTEAGNYAYNYDDLYRLTNVQSTEAGTPANAGYTYDPVGNRQTSMQATDWTHNQNNELLSLTGSAGQSSAATYQYDANGNTIQRNINGTIQNFVYDVDNRLIEVRDAANALIAKYTYDPFGRRIKKEIPSPLAGEGQGEGGLSPSGGGQGEEVFYHYSDEGLIGEYDNTGNQRRIYGYKPNSTWSTDPLFMREGGNIYFYHNDHLGTPQKLTNISGATVWSATYDAFGKAAIDGASTVVSHLRFPGQYFDGETGLHYNWNRYYEPGTGRYVTSDPIGLNGGINMFTYAENNPITNNDYYGLLSYTQVAYNYPTYKRYPTGKLWELIGGKVQWNGENDIFVNTCAIRMSHALNASGLKVPFISKLTVSGKGTEGQKWWYIFKVDTLITHLNSLIGEAKSFTVKSFKKNCKKGIVIFQIQFSNATGHVDLWDGKKTINNRDEYIDRSRNILFWELKE